MDRGAWWATVHRVPKSWTQLKGLSTYMEQAIKMQSYLLFWKKILIDCSEVALVLALSSSIYMYHAAAKLLQLCPTLCDPIDGSPPGSPIPRSL